MDSSRGNRCIERISVVDCLRIVDCIHGHVRGIVGEEIRCQRFRSLLRLDAGLHAQAQCLEVDSSKIFFRVQRAKHSLSCEVENRTCFEGLVRHGASHKSGEDSQEESCVDQDENDKARSLHERVVLILNDQHAQ